ncbi:hypothetical protein FA95DRAFT_1611943 [Auriscalpium vulgare]|uniref:Uncharacterized protein n=1 Tax=Auriscalpium vulgare TaxID=40419 RepID=A0ACB8R8A5_9AGAM|nr:hypothetical protein FA95DRAFT_1611943 [Auriscalpium vulgare]
MNQYVPEYLTRAAEQQLLMLERMLILTYGKLPSQEQTSELEDSDDNIIIHRRRRGLCHNNLLPISWLPTEILAKIFSYLVHATTPMYPQSRPLNRSWIAVIHVCGLWRETAFGSRSLWTSVTSQFGVMWFVNMIARTANMPLSASISSWPADLLDGECLKVLFIRHLPRMQELSLMSPMHSPMRDSFYSMLLGQHAPSLRRLRLSNAVMFRYPSTPAFLNNLTTLEIHQTPNGIQQWLSLFYRPDNDSQWRPSAAVIITALQNMMNLKHLILRHIHMERGSSDMPAQHVTARVILPSLKRFELISDTTTASTLLSNLHIPSAANAILDLSYSGEDQEAMFVLLQDIRLFTSLPSGDDASPPYAIKNLILGWQDSEDTLSVHMWQSETLDHANPNVHLRLTGNASPPFDPLKVRVARCASIWRKLGAPWSVMRVFASEHLQFLSMSGWLEAEQWDAVLKISPRLRRIKTRSFSGLALCKALADATRLAVLPKDGDNAVENAQNLPELTTLKIHNVDLGAYAWTCEHCAMHAGSVEYPYTAPINPLLELIAIREKIGLPLRKLDLAQSVVPDCVAVKLRAAAPAMALQGTVVPTQPTSKMKSHSRSILGPSRNASTSRRARR